MPAKPQLVRLSAVEYEDAHGLIATAATALELPQERVRDLLRSAGERVAHLLNDLPHDSWARDRTGIMLVERSVPHGSQSLFA